MLSDSAREPNVIRSVRRIVEQLRRSLLLQDLLDTSNVNPGPLVEIDKFAVSVELDKLLGLHLQAKSGTTPPITWPNNH